MTSAPPPGGRDPWSDPATPTQAGPPWAEPPAAPAWPPPAGQPQAPPWTGGPHGPYGSPPPSGGWPPHPYGMPAWGPPPRPRTPGTVITAAVLAFVQAVVVLIASLYLWFFASIADVISSGEPGVYTSDTARALATEGTVLATLQLGSVVLLVVGGVLALSRRTPAAYRTLAGALVVQVVLALYWAARLLDVLGSVPGSDGDAALASFSLLFLAAPAVALGMLLAGSARRWFTSSRPG